MAGLRKMKMREHGLVGGKLEGSGCGKGETYLYDDSEEKFFVPVLGPPFIFFRFGQGLRVSIHRTVVSFRSASQNYS